MDLIRTAYKTWIAVFCIYLLPLSALAEGLQPLNLNATYSLAWSGISIGRISVRAHEDASRYGMVIDTRTHGVGSLFRDEKSVLTTEGLKNGSGDYLASSYERRPENDANNGDITLTYDAQGNLLKRVREKDDNPAWRPPVPVEQINQAHDPLTVIFILRRMLYAAKSTEEKAVTTRLYDGMRLVDTTLTRQENSSIDIMDRPVNTIKVGFTRNLLAGYSPKEWKKFSKGKDPRMALYITDDEQFFPVKATVDVALGQVSMTLISKR